jgi:hypothetical protein
MVMKQNADPVRREIKSSFISNGSSPKNKRQEKTPPGSPGSPIFNFIPKRKKMMS